MSSGAPTRPHVDLARSYSLAELLVLTVQLFARHALLLFTTSLLIVAPVAVLVDGAWGGTLRDGPDAEVGVVGLVSLALYTFVVPPLITAFHAIVVRDLGNGRTPTLVDAIREAGPRLPAAFGAVALATLGICLGFLALVVPGIVLIVRWTFVAQAAVLEERSPVEAIKSSGRIVQERWGEVFGAMLVGTVLFGAMVGTTAAVVLASVEDPVAYVVGTTVVQTFAMSLCALFASLLYFTMRARQGLT